jgi:PPIC-type PPIASE domain
MFGMKSLRPLLIILLLGHSGVLVGAPQGLGADVLVKGKGLVITRPEFDAVVRQVETELMTQRNTVKDDRREAFEARLLDRLIFVRLCLARSTDRDREIGRTNSANFIRSVKELAATPADYTRRLTRAGYPTAERFESDKLNEAIAAAVIEREVRSKISISSEAIAKAYQEQPEKWALPESVKVVHLMLATRNPVTGQEASDEQKKAILQKITELRHKVVDEGADFSAMVEKYSEDHRSKATRGELEFGRGATMAEFEAASFSLSPGQFSDIVRTPIGFHIIKCLQKKPRQVPPLAEVESKVRAALTDIEAQKLIPEFSDRIRKEAGLEFSSDAPKAPAAVSPNPASK